MLAGLFSVCRLSHSCVSLSPPSIYCAAALESMQECDESCWVAHSSQPQDCSSMSPFQHQGQGCLFIRYIRGVYSFQYIVWPTLHSPKTAPQSPHFSSRGVYSSFISGVSLHMGVLCPFFLKIKA